MIGVETIEAREGKVPSFRPSENLASEPDGVRCWHRRRGGRDGAKTVREEGLVHIQQSTSVIPEWRKGCVYLYPGICMNGRVLLGIHGRE